MIVIPKDNIPVVLVGDVITRLKDLPDRSIDLIVTSPPYWGQRDYDNKNQLGQENTLEEYITKMVLISKELKRVLKDEGVYFLNVGDKYIDKNQALIPYKLAIELQNSGWVLRNSIIWRKTNPMPSPIKDRLSNCYEPIFMFVKKQVNSDFENYYFNLDNIREQHKTVDPKKNSEYPKYLTEEEYKKIKDKIPKQEYIGKYLNQKRINFGASPAARQSVDGIRYSRQRKFIFDNTKEKEIVDFLRNYRQKNKISTKEIDKIFNYKDTAGHWFRKDRIGRSLPKPEDWFKLRNILKIDDDRYDKIMTETHYVLQTINYHEKGKNPGDVWDMPTANFKDSHFAVFPDELPKRTILCGCPEDGIVLDPFAGSGTTLKVAKELNRKSIGIEIQKEFVKIIKKRCETVNIL